MLCPILNKQTNKPDVVRQLLTDLLIN